MLLARLIVRVIAAIALILMLCGGIAHGDNRGVANSKRGVGPLGGLAKANKATSAADRWWKAELAKKEKARAKARVAAKAKAKWILRNATDDESVRVDGVRPPSCDEGDKILAKMKEDGDLPVFDQKGTWHCPFPSVAVPIDMSPPAGK